ncbi:hypothetical protein G7083_10155 [Vibrio sp. HDW18]|uniref:hypothetical protein n=1 Tax=Vibrio sp. HDW18 TaxID=2714948 RepID=UPI00140E5141|nr:hypothetical protein [Vibrio sp. HDW18]QIL86177.1 hypothetical protein G7083_10155 [Vibrio sp. HDW18]
MWLTISLLIGLAMLGAIYRYAQPKHSAQQRKFELLIGLREVLALCRQHRSLTHQALSQTDRDQTKLSELPTLQKRWLAKAEQLIQIAHFDNKPSYRILQNSLQAVINQWPQASVGKNQRLHGKLIRHCMYLMDDVSMAWLVDAGRAELRDQYHMNWQQIFDAMETLTQLRLCIEDLPNTNQPVRVVHYGQLMQRKLEQLALISPLTLSSAAGSAAICQLNTISDSCQRLDSNALYQLTGEISATIAEVYDHMLNQLVKSLYQPLPQLVLI